MSARDILVEMGFEESIVIDPEYYDNAIIGVSTSGQVVYSYEKIIGVLMEEHGWTMDEAIEWTEFNTVGALQTYGDNAPIIMYDLE